jgi:hypothetical protein
MSILVTLALLALAAVAFIPVRTPAPRNPREATGVRPAAPATHVDEDGPAQPVHLLVIHHSVGGQLLAEPGPLAAEERLSIHRAHPNGGGLRRRLEKAGFVVHEASYGSPLGERTDLFDWLPKFRDQMPAILASGGKNQVVVFKSCYPNSNFRAGDAGAGRPEGPELNLANARASFMALRAEFARQPAILFIYLTAPPLPARAVTSSLYEHLARRLLGRPPPDADQLAAARRAREFNDWLTAADGWLAGYAGRNIAVFDYFDLLTADGRSDFLEFATNDGTDAHPSAEGQAIAARRLAPFICRAWRRAQGA